MLNKNHVYLLYTRGSIKRPILPGLKARLILGELLATGETGAETVWQKFARMEDMRQSETSGVIGRKAQNSRNEGFERRVGERAAEQMPGH